MSIERDVLKKSLVQSTNQERDNEIEKNLKKIASFLPRIDSNGVRKINSFEIVGYELKVNGLIEAENSDKHTCIS